MRKYESAVYIIMKEKREYTAQVVDSSVSTSVIVLRAELIDRQLGCLSKNDDFDGCRSTVLISVTQNASITVKKFFQ